MKEERLSREGNRSRSEILPNDYDYIKRIRISAGLTQKEFSSIYQIPVRTVQNWEAGKRRPPAYIVYILQRLVDYDAQMGILQKDLPFPEI